MIEGSFNVLWLRSTLGASARIYFQAEGKAHDVVYLPLAWVERYGETAALEVAERLNGLWRAARELDDD